MNRFILCFFFFSSRRRHTRLTCDWSSDVCSSDLPLDGARDRLQAEHRELMKTGVSSVGWAVLDQVVDDYEPVAAGIEDDIEEVERSIFGGGGESTERIYFLKREVIEFHRAIAPLLVPLELLERGAYPQIGEDMRPF